MTPMYYQNRTAYYTTNDKYRALLAQGFDEAAAHRMANNIPVIYGPKTI